MTPTWYSTPARVAALTAAVEPKIGTPFRENSAMFGPGGGVSCHNLVAELYFDSAFIPRFEVPTGRARSMIHGDAEALITRIDSTLGEKLAPVDLAEALLPGDLVVFRVGRICLHLGTVVPMRQFVHVLRHQGVALSPLADPTYQIAAIRRPKP